MTDESEEAIKKAMADFDDAIQRMISMQTLEKKVPKMAEPTKPYAPGGIIPDLARAIHGDQAVTLKERELQLKLAQMERNARSQKYTTYIVTVAFVVVLLSIVAVGLGLVLLWRLVL